jgi:hypothetical protein
MSEWLMKSIRQEAQHLTALAAEDEELRADLRELANAILAATERPGTSNGREGAAPRSSALTSAGALTPEATPSAEPLKELTLGRGSPSKVKPQSAAKWLARPSTSHAEVSDLIARCRRKAEAARWATACVRALRRENRFEAENPPADRKIQKWANQLADRLLWLSSSGSLGPEDVAPLEDVAGCFESVAGALVMAREPIDDPKANAEDLERLLTHVAEAQSALKVALLELSAGGDPEQLDVFAWLKETAAREQVFIKRFMRADEHADPALWRELLARIESEPEGEPADRTGMLLKQLRGQINGARATPEAGLDWTAIITTVAEAVAAGAPPSNREIRDALLPLLDELPDRDDLPGEFLAVLREIDRYVASRPAAPGAHGPSVSHWSAEVKEAARLLEGRGVALIGGDRRREAEDALRRALKLKDLFWIETREHQSIESFEAVVARPEVALVLLAIRWSSHSFGEVKQFCERHDKPLVRLPGGYNPNQVAVQILAQCSALLEERGANR